MNVLSCFDGMSCGQIALQQLGIKVDKYYASEIDTYAMQITQKNFPNTIQVGDISKLKVIDLPQIDLIMGGSPCQGFSMAGNRLNFEDPRSKLFFEFVRLVKELKPKYFLLENVRMKQESLDVISEYLGVQPIFINSSKLSAQSRQRYYWTNIPNITQPTESGVLLKDILEDEPQARPTKLTERNIKHHKEEHEKALCMSASMYKGAGNNGMTLVPQRVGTATDINGHDILKRIYSRLGKSPTLNTCGGGNRKPKVNCEEGREAEAYPPIQTDLFSDNIKDEKIFWRCITPLEAERLQTVPDGYTEGVSNTRRFHMLGNGWTVSVIKHILKNMEASNEL